mgnify:CR=1 FL=1
MWARLQGLSHIVFYIQMLFAILINGSVYTHVLMNVCWAACVLKSMQYSRISDVKI